MLEFRYLEPWTSRLLSVLRIVAGLSFLQHGTIKLLGFPTSMGPLNGLTTFAGGLELVGGVLLVLGLFTRPVAFIVAGEMAVAFFMGHVMPQGVIYPAVNHGEAAMLFCFIFLYLSAAGGGAWSLDNAMAKNKTAPAA